MSRLTRDGTAEAVAPDQVLRRERGREIFIFPVQLTTSKIVDLIRLILTLAICDDHTYIYCLYCKIRSLHRRYFQYAHFIPIVGVRKRGAY